MRLWEMTDETLGHDHWTDETLGHDRWTDKTLGHWQKWLECLPCGTEFVFEVTGLGHFPRD